MGLNHGGARITVVLQLLHRANVGYPSAANAWPTLFMQVAPALPAGAPSGPACRPVLETFFYALRGRVIRQFPATLADLSSSSKLGIIIVTPDTSSTSRSTVFLRRGTTASATSPLRAPYTRKALRLTRQCGRRKPLTQITTSLSEITFNVHTVGAGGSMKSSATSGYIFSARKFAASITAFGNRGWSVPEPKPLSTRHGSLFPRSMFRTHIQTTKYLKRFASI